MMFDSELKFSGIYFVEKKDGMEICAVIYSITLT